MVIDITPSPIRKIQTNNPATLALGIKGSLSDADIENLYGLMEAEASLHATFNIIIIFYSSDEVEWAALFKSDVLSMNKDLHAKVNHYAVVGGPSYMSFTTKFLSPFLAPNFRWFAENNIQDAWDFVDSQPIEEME